jgi:hypothetical protein
VAEEGCAANGGDGELGQPAGFADLGCGGDQCDADGYETSQDVGCFEELGFEEVD